MEKLPENAAHFVSSHIQEAVYKTEYEEQIILLESRQFPTEEELLFTIVNDQEFRVPSIHELVYALPSLMSLSLSHSIRLFWNGVIKKATFIEIFTPSRTQRPPLADLQIKLAIDDKSFQTTICDTLQDAIWELHDLTRTEAEWRLYTCYHCQYSGQARDYLVGDRQYWCYRDVPDAIAEIKARGKPIRSETRWAGAYYVDAFHTCAAWRPLVLSSEQQAG
jgi:hypothetical protein